MPIPIKPNFQTFTAMNWIIQAADEKERGIRIWDTLATELLSASRNEVNKLVLAIKSFQSHWLTPVAGNHENDTCFWNGLVMGLADCVN